MAVWQTNDIINADKMNEVSFFRENIGDSINLNKDLSYNTLLQKNSTQTAVYSLSGTDDPDDANNDFPCLDKNSSIIHFQTGTQTACQLVLASNNNNYIRRKTGAGWTKWSNLANPSNIKSIGSQDLNTITDSNSLYFLNTTSYYSNAPIHCKDTAFIKTFTESDNNYNYGLQLVYSTTYQNKAYIRGFRKQKELDNTFEGTNWECLNSHYVSTNPTEAAAIKKDIWCCSQHWSSILGEETTYGQNLTAQNEGIPFIDYPSKAEKNATVDSSTGKITYPAKNTLYWGRWGKDMILQGLPYSSVVGQDGDILYSRTLATFYSAVLNPYSILYTRAIEEPVLRKNTSRASCYGVVCSSYASALAGSKLYFTSKNLFMLIKNKIVNNTLTLTAPKTPSDLSVGMIRVTIDHMQIISNILYDDQGNALIELTDSQKPLPMTSTISFQQLKESFELALKTCTTEEPQGYFCINLSNLKNSNNNTLIQTESFITLDDYATDVITEYGNNTWFIAHTDSESNFYIQDIKLYSPLETINKLYYKSHFQSYTEITLEDSGQALKEGQYNIADKINQPGVWYVTTDQNTTNPAIINVVDFGEGYLSTALDYYTFYVNDFENLIPVGFKLLLYTNPKRNVIKPDTNTVGFSLFSRDDKRLEFDYSEDSFGYFIHNNAHGSTLGSKEYKLRSDSLLSNPDGKSHLMFKIPSSNFENDDWCVRVYFEVRETPESPRYGMSFLEIYSDNDENNKATRTKNYITLEDIS